MGGRTDADAGHRLYTRRFLRTYDPVILGVYTRWVWRVPNRRVLDLYERHAASRHLDVGPGTGWFLARVAWPAGTAITLLDASPDALAFAAGRVEGADVTTVRADVRTPLPVEGPYGSIGLSHVLHCLGGPVAGKAAALRHLAGVLAADGVLFGATVLGDPAVHTRLSRPVLRALNRRGIFSNLADSAASVRAMLEASFEEVDLEVVGAGALFSARRPRAGTSAGRAPT